MLYEFRRGEQFAHMSATRLCANAASSNVLVFRPIHDGLLVFVRFDGIEIHERPRPLF